MFADATCREVGPHRKPFVLSPSVIFSNKHGKIPSSVRCVTLSMLCAGIYPYKCLKLSVLRLIDAYIMGLFLSDLMRFEFVQVE